MRNHNTLTRDKLIPELAKCVPEGHTVSLDNPELFVLVEIFKVCSSWIEIPFCVAHFITRRACAGSV